MSSSSDSRKDSMRLAKFDEFWAIPIEKIIQDFVDDVAGADEQLERRLNGVLERDANVEVLLEAAFKSISQQSTEEDNASALNKLGWMYQNGYGVEKNREQAVTYYRQAVEKGDVSGMSNLGDMYLHGLGVEKNEEQAVAYYRQAVEKGDACGMNGLGYAYRHGLGVEKNAEQGAVYYHQAAEKGYASAINNLGYIYQHGLGVEKNAEQAITYYRQAVEKGSTYAMKNLGYMYEHGLGVEENAEQAVAYYRQAVEKGHTNAMINLKNMYRHGLSVGIFHDNRGEVKQAVESFCRAIDAIAVAAEKQGFDAVIKSIGNFDRLERIVASFKDETRLPYKHYITGMIALGRQDQTRARSEFSKAIKGDNNTIALKALEQLAKLSITPTLEHVAEIYEKMFEKAHDMPEKRGRLMIKLEEMLKPTNDHPQPSKAILKLLLAQYRSETEAALLQKKTDLAKAFQVQADNTLMRLAVSGHNLSQIDFLVRYANAIEMRTQHDADRHFIDILSKQKMTLANMATMARLVSSLNYWSTTAGNVKEIAAMENYSQQALQFCKDNNQDARIKPLLTELGKSPFTTISEPATSQVNAMRTPSPTTIPQSSHKVSENKPMQMLQAALGGDSKAMIDLVDYYKKIKRLDEAALFACCALAFDKSLRTRERLALGKNLAEDSSFWKDTQLNSMKKILTSFLENTTLVTSRNDLRSLQEDLNLSNPIALILFAFDKVATLNEIQIKNDKHARKEYEQVDERLHAVVESVLKTASVSMASIKDAVTEIYQKETAHTKSAAEKISRAQLVETTEKRPDSPQERQLKDQLLEMVKALREERVDDLADILDKLPLVSHNFIEKTLHPIVKFCQRPSKVNVDRLIAVLNKRPEPWIKEALHVKSTVSEQAMTALQDLPAVSSKTTTTSNRAKSPKFFENSDNASASASPKEEAKKKDNDDPKPTIVI